MNRPNINVTPLIDVLLVLLIIFMVVSPLKPSAFRAKVPHDSNVPGIPHPDTLLVNIGSDLSLTLNRETGLGSAEDPTLLTDRLREVFRLRVENQDYSETETNDPGFTASDRIQRTVFIKAPKNMAYGNVAKVVDAVKLAGAVPISLQVDSLE